MQRAIHTLAEEGRLERRLAQMPADEQDHKTPERAAVYPLLVRTWARSTHPCQRVTIG